MAPKKKVSQVTSQVVVSTGRNRDRIQFGSVILDSALKGGIPRGGLTVISGRTDVGKTLLCSHLVANVVKNGGKAMIVDLEGRFFDRERLLNRGLSSEQIEKQVKIVSGLFTVEDTARLIRGELTTNPPDIIVLDSIAALHSASMIDSLNEGGKSPGIGDFARAVTREFKDIIYTFVQNTNTAIVMTTQKRTNILPYGAYEGDFLPNILKFASLVHLQLKLEEEMEKSEVFKVQSVKGSGRPNFRIINFEFEKNQVGYPKARGLFRYILFTRPEWGIRIGDIDLIYEVCAYGAHPLFGIVKSFKRDGKQHYTVVSSGRTYSLGELYCDPKVREAFLSETLEPLYQKMTTYWEGGLVALTEDDLGGEEE